VYLGYGLGLLAKYLCALCGEKQNRSGQTRMTPPAQAKVVHCDKEHQTTKWSYTVKASG